MNRLFFIIAIGYLLTCQQSFAYIDPNTGGMLFSIALGSITTILFLLNTLFAKIKSKFFFSKKLAKNKHDFAIYSEGNQYWCVFKPILDEFEKRQINVAYYTSAKNDIFFSQNYKYIQGEYIGKGNKAYFKLAFLNADICLLTTPHLDVMQLKRSKLVKHYSHVLHVAGFSMDYKLFALDYYDSIMCDANYQVALIEEIEEKRNLSKKELIVTGSSYLDYYKNQIKNFKSNKNSEFTVLIASTWGEFGLLNKGGNLLIDELSKTNYKIIIRPHPQSLMV